MSKRRALSAEEKQSKLLELFHETNEVYQLKELERLAPTEKGIVLQSVKTTLQELVDSDLVESEKISGGLYFWSFPSESVKKLQRQIENTKAETAKVQQRLEIDQEYFNAKGSALEDSAATDVLTNEIKVLKKEKNILEGKIKQLQSSVNYAEIATKEAEIMKLVEAANRWTDNIFMTKTWCKRKFDKQDRELNKAFGIPDELDYVDVDK